MAGIFRAIKAQDYWRDLAPPFHIAYQNFLSPTVTDTGASCAAASADIATNGYTQIRGIDLAANLESMAAVARALTARDLDSVFCFVYDEFWRPYFRLDTISTFENALIKDTARALSLNQVWRHDAGCYRFMRL